MDRQNTRRRWERWSATVPCALLVASCGTVPIDLDGDGQFPPEDCNDAEPAVYAGAAEACDDLDADCDGRLDDVEAVDAQPYYPDLDGDGSGAGDPVMACAPPLGYVAVEGDCDDRDSSWHGATSVTPPGWPVARCGAGHVIQAADDLDAWTEQNLVPASNSVQAYFEPGCAGAGLAFDYRIEDPGEDGQGWVLLGSPLPDAPVDLSGWDYLLFSFAGSPGSLADVELKLVDGTGCESQVTFDGGGALPALRTVAVSLRQFVGAEVSGCTTSEGSFHELDQRDIRALIIGVSSHAPTMGTLHVDDVSLISREALLELAGPVPTGFECPYQDPPAMARIIDRMVTYQQDYPLEYPGTDGLIPTWYGAVGEPIFQTAAEALALTALTLETVRRPPGPTAAAARLADVMIGLQQDGAWAERYEAPEGALMPAGAVSVAHTAWMVMALERYQRSLEEDLSASSYRQAVSAGADFLVASGTAWIRQSECAAASTTGSSDPVDALEAFATWLALRAVGRLEQVDPGGGTDDGDALGAWIDACFWDEEEGRYLASPGELRPALDVTGAFGAVFLELRGDSERALEVLRLSQALFSTRTWSGTSVNGLSDAYAYQPSVERTAMYAAAGGPGAAYAIRELLKLERDVDFDGVLDGEFPGAMSTFDAGADGYYTGWTGLSVSAWVYLAMHGGVLQEP